MPASPSYYHNPWDATGPLAGDWIGGSSGGAHVDLGYYRIVVVDAVHGLGNDNHSHDGHDHDCQHLADPAVRL
jgi:hypothetical protein